MPELETPSCAPLLARVMEFEKETAQGARFSRWEIRNFAK
jgi:hypothetical protein